MRQERVVRTLQLATSFLFACMLIGCLCEQFTDDHSDKQDQQLDVEPHFDSLILSGPPLNNMQPVNQHADAQHPKNNRTVPAKPSSSAHGDADTGNTTGPIKNLEIQITSAKDGDQDILPELQKNPLIQNLLNGGTNSTNELNMTIYVIKKKKDSKNATLNTNTDYQTTKNVSRAITSEEMHGGRNKTSRKVVPQNITVFLDTPESVESEEIPNNNSGRNLTTVMNEPSMLENIQKTWSWNQRTRTRWPNNRRVGGRRYRWRRPQQPGRWPSFGGGRRPSQGIRPPQGGWTRPSQGGNQGSSLRPTQGGAGQQPGGGGSSSASQGDREFEQEALDAHNKFRAVHNAPPMKLNDDLNQQAKAYAQKIAALGALQHSSSSERGQDVGENLAMGCSSFGNPMSGKKAVTNWYNEVCQYDFNNPGFSMNTGHFTQVAWQDSTELGIGKATGHMGQMPCVYVVGRYRTAGNFNDMFKQQVLVGGFDRSYCNNVRK